MARGLLRSGARVLISGRRRDALEKACATLREEVPGATVRLDTVDLYDRASIDAFTARALAETGGVDIFVGNAGAVHAQHFGDITYEETDRVLQLNLIANIALSQAFIPHMKKQAWGRFIYSSSTASELAAPLCANVVYAASKSGLNAFARALAGDLGRHGITVNNILFGMFLTTISLEAFRKLKETQGEAALNALVRSFTEMTALGRLGEAEEVEGLVQLLASDAGRYITGTSIPIDGGTSIMMTAFPGS
jgi:NAD(P)-dependent dehydrogenase (short-subunit alcohol dehydrogenase family)